MEVVRKYSNELSFLKEVDRVKLKVDEGRPLDKVLEKKVIQKLRLDWNYNSNAIEGNSFSHGETVALIMEGITAKGKPLKDALDIEGHNQAIELLLSIVKEDRRLNETDIRNLHKILLTKDYVTSAETNDGQRTSKLIKVGEYKSSPNHVRTVTGEIHYYASPEETPAKMTELVDSYNQIVEAGDFHPIVLASVFHHRFVNIHPFDDGNGRMARLLTNLILLKYNYPISVIQNKEKSSYYAKLSQADSGELIPLIQLIALSVNNALTIYLRAINGEDITTSADLDRDIELFMQSLDLTKEKIQERSNERIMKVSFMIFSFLQKKLNNFEKAFQTKQEFIRNKKSNVRWNVLINTELENEELFNQKVGVRIVETNSTVYSYALKQDLRSNTRVVVSELEIIFYPKTYVVSYSNFQETKYYGEKIIDAKILDLLNEIIKFYKESIKNIYDD